MIQSAVMLLSACAPWAAFCQDLPANCGPPEQFAQDLKDNLSAETAVYLSGSTDFEKATIRWSELEIPNPNIVVVPASEEDVACTVRRANQCGLPILAYNGVHGAITTLGKMDRGIAIQLSQLSSVAISQDGATATIGGGTSSKAVTDALWASGKQTVTGTCECVSYLGPALGGGHGWLQGYYGLVADQFVSLNVVLANGSRIKVDSSSDLWWAMRGAGQNFGIVTSAVAKVYDIVYPNWAIETLIFSGDKVESVYSAANQYLSNLPAGIINWSYWLNVPDVDPDKPVILFYIIQEGVTVVDPRYTSPFRDIGPLSTESKSGSYRDLAAWTGIALDSPPCQKSNLANPRFPLYLQRYNTTAQRDAYDVFAANVGGAKSPFNASLFMFEGYPQQGVRGVNSDTSAFAFRADNLLVAPLLTYAPTTTGQGLDENAARIGNQLRNIIYQGSGREELHTYINYAYGNEDPVNWYGYEDWRQNRLQNLKQKYDPKSQFSFYAPVG